MRGRLNTVPRASGQPVSAIEALRAVTASRLQRLALIPELVHLADCAQTTASSAIIDLPAQLNNPKIEICQQGLHDLHQHATGLARQLREQLILIDELLASQGAIDTSANMQLDDIVTAIAVRPSDSDVLARCNSSLVQDGIYRNLHQLNDLLHHRLGVLQQCITDLSQCQLSLAQMRLRRLFCQNTAG